MSIFLVCIIDKEVVILGGAWVLSDDEAGFGEGDEGLYRGIILKAEIDEDIEFEFDEVMQLRHHRFAEPVEVFIREEVAGQLREAVEGDFFIVDISDQADVVVFGLQFREDCIDFLIGVLVGDFAEEADRASVFE